MQEQENTSLGFDISELFGETETDKALDLGRIQETPPEPKATLQQRFEEFHRMNPHVLTAIITVAQEMKNRGFNRLSIKMIFEHLRYVYAMRTQGDKYKLNNNFHAYYARVVSTLHPKLNFQTRAQKEEFVLDWDALGIDPPI